ncbi:MAG: hypothetical protein ACYC7D_04050 [Nitrososphaerales archaeon]
MQSGEEKRPIAKLHSMLGNKKLDIQKLRFSVEPVENGVSINVEFQAIVN